jgi:hypothetical protein
MSPPPGWDGRLQTPRAFLRQPDGAPAQILLDDRDLDEAVSFERTQSPGQCRLVEARAFGQCPDRIVPCRRNMGHEAELSDAQIRLLHPRFQEARDPPGGQPDVQSCADTSRLLRVGDQGLSGSLLPWRHSYMYLHIM